MMAPAPTARRRARELAFRLAYQADVMAEPAMPEWSGEGDDPPMSADQRALVDDLLAVLRQRSTEVDDLIRRAAQHWDLERLAATDRSVLRIAIAELIGRPGTPARVVLDEAIDIARRYGGEGSDRFVNGVLDHAARVLRPGEV
jgi:N utilization substance protein B